MARERNIVRSWYRMYSSFVLTERRLRTRCSTAVVARDFARVGHGDRRQLDVEDLGERFGREQVGLATPLEVRHEIRLGRGLTERGTEGELVREREREVVALDGVEIDGLAGDLAVAVVQRGEVAEPDDGVAHAPRGEIHHRVPDVADLDVEHGNDAAA